MTEKFTHALFLKAAKMFRYDKNSNRGKMGFTLLK